MEENNMQRYDILIVNYNRLDYLKQTIASLISTATIANCERLIIVDNASTENGVSEFLDELRMHYGAYVVSCPLNKGWGAAVNTGIGISQAPYVLLCNNDIEFKPDFLTPMFVAFERHPNIGILGAWRHIHHGVVQGGVQDDTFVEMDNVPAVAWLLPKSAMIEIGFVPEHGACDTKGGNGEDTGYVLKMKESGRLVGVTACAVGEEKLAHHIDGY